MSRSREMSSRRRVEGVSLRKKLFEGARAGGVCDGSSLVDGGCVWRRVRFIMHDDKDV